VTAVVMHEERRDFSRIALSRPAAIEVGQSRVACELVDISLRGALIRVKAPLVAVEGQACRLVVHLDQGKASILMRGEVAHTRGGDVGVCCHELDVESAAHLRRLLEVSLGSEKLLERELAALLASAPRATARAAR
jgi:hypothetical protein